MDQHNTLDSTVIVLLEHQQVTLDRQGPC